MTRHAAHPDDLLHARERHRVIDAELRPRREMRDKHQSGGLSLLDDFGTMVRIELNEELAIPFTGRRHITVRGARITLPSGATTMLRVGTSTVYRPAAPVGARPRGRR